MRNAFVHGDAFLQVNSRLNSDGNSDLLLDLIKRF